MPDQSLCAQVLRGRTPGGAHLRHCGTENDIWWDLAIAFTFGELLVAQTKAAAINFQILSARSCTT
jgi:hypothetical protein